MPCGDTRDGAAGAACRSAGRVARRRTNATSRRDTAAAEPLDARARLRTRGTGCSLGTCRSGPSYGFLHHNNLAFARRRERDVFDVLDRERCLWQVLVRECVNLSEVLVGQLTTDLRHDLHHDAAVEPLHDLELLRDLV